MGKTIYLINPAADAPTYFGAESVAHLGLRPTAAIADLAIATVAALAPADFEVHLCDENVARADLDTEADFVGLTGKISQWPRMRRLADELRRRGRTVVIGGPFASLCPAVVAEHCDVLVRGEVEEIAAGLFADLRSGRWKPEYVGGRPALDLVPVPRWDLYPNHRALLGAVQTSRGCPFQCEFCDVIQYLGRHQRHKPVSHVLRELDVLYRHGYRAVFFADDNFTANRQHAKELLAALEDWNLRQVRGKVTFSTQLSIDAARDEELLRMCAAAGLIHAFIGIETPNAESLRSARKLQNLGVDLVSQIGRFHAHGIWVTAGMIVGFDHDDATIFDRQKRFADAAALPVVTLGALVAPSATPLHERLRAEGRLLADGSEVAATPWSTNISPRLMTHEQLLDGVDRLVESLWRPEAFGERLLAFLGRVGERRDPKHRRFQLRSWLPRRPVDRDALREIGKIALLGRRELVMVARALWAVVRRPQLLDFVLPALLHFAQARHMSVEHRRRATLAETGGTAELERVERLASR